MYSSSHCKDSRTFEVNSSSVLGMLEVGAGKAGLEKFCVFLNMPNAMTDEAYKNNLQKVKDALEHEANESMNKAAVEEKGSEKHSEKSLRTN